MLAAALMKYRKGEGGGKSSPGIFYKISPWKVHACTMFQELAWILVAIYLEAEQPLLNPQKCCTKYQAKRMKSPRSLVKKTRNLYIRKLAIDWTRMNEYIVSSTGLQVGVYLCEGARILRTEWRLIARGPTDYAAFNSRGQTTAAARFSFSSLLFFPEGETSGSIQVLRIRVYAVRSGSDFWKSSGKRFSEKSVQDLVWKPVPKISLTIKRLFNICWAQL